MMPDTDQISVESLVPNAQSNGSSIPLSEHVRTAVEQYFLQINGHPACDLYNFVIAEVEKPLIETVLKHTGHNQTKAAKTLGISRSTLRNKMNQYGLS